MTISNHVIQHGMKIGTATVTSNDLRTAGTAVPGRVLASIGYITIHNTGLVDVKANNFHRALKTQNSDPNGRQASWTLTVDDIEIYQETKLNWETWHAGNSTGNKNSISIEMCMWSSATKQKQTYENAAALVAKLMKQYGLSISKIKQHYDWSGKNCPQYLRESKYGYNWSWFISRVQSYYNGGDVAPPAEDEKRVAGTITCLVDSLNVRKEADFDSPITGSLNKGQVVQVMAIKNGLYKIKEGQWCSAGTSYVKFTELTEDAYECTTDVLNVRSGRGSSFSKVGTLLAKDRVAIWGISKDKAGDDWGCFRYSFVPDVVGFVHMGYMKKV